jgi:type IV secretory pathway VirB2 component (pilin)
VTTEIAKYVPVVVKLCYAIAGVVAVVGAISIYIAMNNEENDIKKKIMMTVGACIFLVAAAQALPLFFGVTN